MARTSLPWIERGDSKFFGSGRRGGRPQPRSNNGGGGRDSSPHPTSRRSWSHAVLPKFQSSRDASRRKGVPVKDKKERTVGAYSARGHPNRGDGEKDMNGTAVEAQGRPHLPGAPPLEKPFRHVAKFHHGDHHCHNINPFFVTSRSILSPRADVWLFLLLSSIVSAASLSVSSPAATRSAAERFALAAMGTSTCVAFVVAASFRYRPSRGCLTRPLFLDQEGRPGDGVVANLTPELAFAVGAFLLWCIAAGLAFRPSAYMAVARDEIWNANLFFATWLSSSFTAYLVADLVTAADPRGTLPKAAARVMGNAVARAWALLFVAAVSLVAFSAALRNGPTCDAMEANVCKATVLGIAFGVLGMVLPGGYFAASLVETQLREQSSSNRNPKLLLQQSLENGGSVAVIMAGPPPSRRDLVSALLSVTSLVTFSANVAFATSPALQPFMSEPCNVYFSSWICFAISLYLCILHAEVYLVPASTADVAAFGGPFYDNRTQFEYSNEPTYSFSFVQEKKPLERAASRMSGSTANTSKKSSDYDDDPAGEDDDLLTAVVDSKSDDGPVLYLSNMGQSSTEMSALDDDASYPSVTQSYLPVVGTGEGAKQSPRNCMREQHKPRSINPEGNHLINHDRNYSNGTDSAKLEPSVQGMTGSGLEPPESGDSITMGTEDIDTKRQAKVSSSDSDWSGRKRSVKGRRDRYRGKHSTSQKGQQIMGSTSFHADELADEGAKAPNKSKKAKGFYDSVDNEWSISYDAQPKNPLDRTTRPPAKSLQADSAVSRDPLSFHSKSRRGNQQPEPLDSMLSVDPPSPEQSSLGTDPPSFQQHSLGKPRGGGGHTFHEMECQNLRVPQQQQQSRQSKPPQQSLHNNLRQQQCIIESQPFESVVGTSYAVGHSKSPEISTRSIVSTKSKSTKSSSTKAKPRSESRRKKRSSKSRSKSRTKSCEKGGEKKSPLHSNNNSNSRQNNFSLRGSNARRSPNSSIRQGQPSPMRNYARRMSSNTNPPTISHESSGGIPGQGPPTLSCSGDYSNETSSAEASVPLTNEEGMEAMATQAMMGHVGPGSRAQSPYTMRSSDTENDLHRPMITIQDAHPDAMSVLSDPTMVEFGPPGEEWTKSETPSSINRQSYSMHRGSSRHSYASTAEKNSSKEPANDEKELRQGNDNKTLRQGAVDKMVMEALRQAQEAREGSVGGLKPPGADGGAEPYKQNGQSPKPQLQATSQLVEEMKDLTMRRSSSASKHSQNAGQNAGRKAQSFHHNKAQKKQKPPSFRNRSDPEKILRSPHSSARDSTSDSRNNEPMVPGSIHSFYSGSGATSYETGDAFDC